MSKEVSEVHVPAVVLPIITGASGCSVFSFTNSSRLVGLIHVQLFPLNFTDLLYWSVN